MKVKALLFLIPSLILAVSGSPLAIAQEQERVYAIWGDQMEGRKVYADKGCGKCHAINGVGPTIGPDLGKTLKEPLSLTQLAGVMWNHAPEMRLVAKEKGIQWEPFKDAEMRDLIAFIYFLRMLDQPWNGARGNRLFAEKGCSACHSLGGKGARIGTDLSQWRLYGSSILWAEVMWKHALEMEEKMAERRLEWQKFKGTEVLDLITFIQSKAVEE